jgi:YidC/Oxa1 family membrane protein insertase
LIASFMAPEWIVTPMQSLITWFLTLTGSYGLSIILLTVAVRMLILPLTIYQTKSMKSMQEVQPLMKALQDKYKDQPEKLNQEMMALYKEHKVNPLAGCLPLLIQMPFLYAIFAVLQSFNPEAFGASTTFLWMDLATKNTGLAVITVASMFLQSWLSGVGNDPNQKMMMWMMPLMFGYITFNMQSGVVLYWVVSTIVGLIQQAIYPGFPRFKGGLGAKGEAGAR